MSDDEKPKKVGYGKPPTKSQFKPGKSGNPKGRPKGSKNKLIGKDGQSQVADIIITESERLLTINDGGKRKKISALEAVIRSMITSAIKGRIGAQKNVLILVSQAANEKEKKWIERLEAVHAYKKYWDPIYKEYDAHIAQGHEVEPPGATIDPKDIIIDQSTGSVKIVHYFTKKELEDNKIYEAEKAEHRQEIIFLKEKLKTEIDEKKRAFYQKELERSEEMVFLLDKLVPDLPEGYSY